ncbi:MAG TPA: zinc-ribbon domain-containing protein [Actinomycetota bacterium]|nr:zinc-ribbon domain-containing protein [Actinomycetota bacterium]
MEANACRWCGTEIVDGAQKCSSCGARVAPLAGASENDATVEPAQSWAPPVVVGAPSAQTAARAAPIVSEVPQPPPGLTAAPTWTPPPTAARAGTHPLVWVMIALVAAVAAFATTRMMGGGPLTFPDSVLGQPKMTGPEIDAIVDTFEDTRIGGQTFRAAFYGSGTPTLMIVVADSSSLSNPEESWSGFGGGFASTSGTSVQLQGQETATIDGVNYICAPVTDMASTVCQWTDDRTTGYVLDYTVGDAKAGISRAQSVYEVVVTG